MPIRIELKDVSLSYGKSQVLAGISQVVRPSETICILGPSGSGKTSLIKIMAGLEPPDTGEVLYNGHSYFRLRSRRQMQFQQQTGFVFQDAALISNMNIYDNIALPLRYHYRMKEAEIHDRVTTVLETFELEDKAMLRPANLSIGKKKLASLARAIVLDPAVLFYDEPVSNIDQASANMVLSLINIKKQTGLVTSIIVTSDIDFAKAIADRIFIIHRGQIVIAGSVKEVLASKDSYVLQIINAIKVHEQEVMGFNNGTS